MKFKILEVKWVGNNLQVAFSHEDCVREVIGWDGETAIKMAKNNQYIAEIKDLLKNREIGKDKRPKVDAKVIGKEFNTED